MTTAQSKIATATRFVLGGMFLFSGLNGLFHFAPMPPMPAAAGEVLGGIVATGYFLPPPKITEGAAGALLLSGGFVPLPPAGVAPLLVKIVAFPPAPGPPGLAH